MADQKLSELTELAATPADADEVYIRDVSEAAAAESKRITIANLLAGGVALAPMVVSDFQANAASGTAGSPERLNDNSTAAFTRGSLNQYWEVAFDFPFYIEEFRMYGISSHSGDGKFKIEIDLAGVYYECMVDIPVVDADAWGSWTTLTKPCIAIGMKLTVTTQDGSGYNYIYEMEMRG